MMSLTMGIQQELDDALSWIWDNRVADFAECKNRLPILLERVNQLQYALGALHCLVLEAQLLVYEGKFKEAIIIAKNALEAYLTLNDDLYLIRTHNILAVSYMSMSEFGEALQHYKIALSLCEKLPDIEMHSILLLNLGEMYRGALDENEKALPFFLQALAINENTSNRWIPMILGGTALCLIRLGRSEEARPLLIKLEALIDTVLDARIQIGIYQFLSQSYRELHEVDKTIHLLNAVLKDYNGPQYAHIRQNLYLILAQALQERGDSEEALTYCHLILNNELIDKESTLSLNIYKVMAQAYKNLGQHEQEANYLNLVLVKMEKEISNRLERHTSLLVADMKYKTLEKDNEIHRLKNVELKEQAAILEMTAAELQTTLDDLVMTQEQLIKTEKMASLGDLVAGVSHEINTPLGVGITIASFIENNLKEIQRQLLSDTLSKKYLVSTIEATLEANDTLNTNLGRAAEIVNSFKQVAVDQSSFDCRSFNVLEYINDTLVMLQPYLKKNSYTILIDCDENLSIVSYPGALYQIISQLTLNALTHGFKDRDKGRIHIEVSSVQGHFRLRFTDDGQGILPEHQTKIFDPFYTTNKNKGNIGLGLHSLYNMIFQMLQGTITLVESSSEGTIFEIRFREGCR